MISVEIEYNGQAHHSYEAYQNSGQVKSCIRHDYIRRNFVHLKVLTCYKPPKIIAIDSPNPNTKKERIVIQVRTLFDTDFTSPSIGGLLFRCTLSVRSLGV